MRITRTIKNLGRIGLVVGLFSTMCLRPRSARSETPGSIQLTPAMLGTMKLKSNTVVFDTIIRHMHGLYVAAQPDEYGCPGTPPPGIDLRALDRRFLHSIVKMGKSKAVDGREILVVMDYLVQQGANTPTGPVNNPPELQYVLYASRTKIEKVVELKAGSYDTPHFDEKIQTHDKQMVCEQLSRLRSNLEGATPKSPANPFRE